jgi:hypothetical protein
MGPNVTGPDPLWRLNVANPALPRNQSMSRATFAFTLVSAIAAAASAVLIDGVDGTADISPFPNPALDHVGRRGGLSAIYLGHGVVLTASHVGAGDVDFGGTVHPCLPGTGVRLANPDGTYADLLMFEVYPRPDLPDLRIVETRPASQSVLLVAGNGLDRGAQLWWDPNGTSPPGMTAGFSWNSTTHLRWGFNNAEMFPTARVFNTQVFGSYFDAGQTLPEAQAVTGDSGGGVFSLVVRGYSAEWQLAGVIIGIGQYSGQPVNTSFFGNRTYYADLAYYRTQIVDAIELPEPRGAGAAGVVLLALLARRRRQPVHELRARRWATASRSVLSPPIG